MSWRCRLRLHRWSWRHLRVRKGGHVYVGACDDCRAQRTEYRRLGSERKGQVAALVTWYERVRRASA